MSRLLLERGFGSTKANEQSEDQVKSISTTFEADSHLICRIGSTQYAVSTGQNSTLLYKSRQTTVPFPSRLDNQYCEEEEGNYGPKFTKAYGASHINNVIPQKEKDPRSFTLPCFINNTCFDNALVDLEASASVMPLSTYLNLGLSELAHTRLTVELADMTLYIYTLSLIVSTMAALYILDKLGELADSPRLQDNMKVVFVQAHGEDESFIALMHDLCSALRRGEALKPLDYMKEMVCRDSATLGVLEQLLAGTHVGMHLKASYVAEMEETR
ncbi:hypothetical protein Tco_1492339 [Tanacetum coccineum]